MSHKVAGDKSGNFAGMPITTPKEVSECLSSWLSYLQMLNGLCGAGSRLSHCLGALVQDTSSPCHTIVTQCQAIWEELVKATAVATSAVKSQVLATLQEINTSGDTDADTHKSHEQNQQVVCVILTMFISSVLLLQQVVCIILTTLISSVLFLQQVVRQFYDVHQFCIVSSASGVRQFDDVHQFCIVASASGVRHLDDVHQFCIVASASGVRQLDDQVVCGSLMMFINLQHQFCIACCEFLGTMALSSCCQQTVDGRHDSDCSVGVVQHFFSRLYSPAPAPATTQHRSPLHFPPCSLQVQDNSSVCLIYALKETNPIGRWKESKEWSGFESVNYRVHTSRLKKTLAL
uniref:(California timema) hypothetical protein n=1 Tax=Timema californicum TaxID=61474 RepID=A0A7R9P779_TIMCA|nr:unnamed protein product [Timema californicum]